MRALLKCGWVVTPGQEVSVGVPSGEKTKKHAVRTRRFRRGDYYAAVAAATTKGPTETLENERELLFNCGAGEEGPSRGHFEENAPYAPHIDVGRVLRGAEQDIGGSIPVRGKAKTRIRLL